MRLIVCWMICFLCGVQQTASSQWQAGPEAGLLVSRFSHSQLGEVKWKAAPAAGFYAAVPLTDKRNWFFRTGLIYARAGAVLKTDEQVRYLLNYLQCPLAIHYQTKKNIWLETGPVPGWALTRKITDGTISYSMASYIKQVDLSWMAALSYYLPAFKTGLRLRFSQSLLNTGRNTGNNLYQTQVAAALFYQVLPRPKGK